MAKNVKTQDVEPVEANTSAGEPKFTFDQLIKSERFRNDVDILTAILDHNGSYTAVEVEELIDDFKRKVVK